MPVKAVESDNAMRLISRLKGVSRCSCCAPDTPGSSRDPGDAAAQRFDQLFAVAKIRRLRIENFGEGALLECDLVELIRDEVHSGRVANDLDQPIRRVQSPQEIIILAI